MAEQVDPGAGKPLSTANLVNIAKLVTAYFVERPDPSERRQRVTFGTSGHRGSSLRCSFNEAHILAISQAIVEYRTGQETSGPLFLGMDTHALSEPAFVSALEVLAAHAVDVMVDDQGGYTPTPVISHAILEYNRGRTSDLADGIVITPSHNPPEDGGFKYNPPHGGPADTDATRWVENRANEIIATGLAGIRRIPYAQARAATTTHPHDYMGRYVTGLGSIVDLEAVREAKLRIGVDPLGGAAVQYWSRIADHYALDLTVVNPDVDPTFRFMPADWDGRIRMDCSSPYAMSGLIALRDKFDIAFGNDTDTDRHGIVTRSAGLLNPNHYLSVAISYLFGSREHWRADAAIGKTVVSSSMIDRVAAQLGRKLYEVPVGFKWFVGGLRDGSLGFGGEESAGASFLRRDGSVWSTDKDGLIMGLLAAEILARRQCDPGEVYQELTRELGSPIYERIDAPASPEQKEVLQKLAPSQLQKTELAGDRIDAVLTAAPGNGAAIGGLKVSTQNGWFAARPSGTEDVYKLYAESFKGSAHLKQIQEEARSLIADVLASADESRA